jgi:hypothetical protein
MERYAFGKCFAAAFGCTSPLLLSHDISCYYFYPHEYLWKRVLHFIGPETV